MKKNIIILALAAALAVVYFVKPTTGTPTASPAIEPEPVGFEQPLIITDADAWNAIGQFKIIGARAGITNTGGVITTTALEQILSRATCNAVAFRFATDSTGRLAPAGKVFLVLGSVEMRNVSGTFQSFDVAGARYASRNWCPPNCMKFVVENPVTRQMQTFE